MDRGSDLMGDGCESRVLVGAMGMARGWAKLEGSGGEGSVGMDSGVDEALGRM